MSKTAVVTGASSGIGRATAEHFARKGYDLALIARREDLLKILVAELDKIRPGKYLPLACDVSDWKQVESAARKVEAEFSHVHVLIDNAGAFEYQSLEKSDPEKLNQMIDVNVRGLIYVSKAFLPHLRKSAAEKQWAKMVNVSSISGLWGFSHMSVYTATKFAVAGFSSSLRRELKGLGIQVSTIYPGPVNTRLPRGQKPQKKMVMVPDQIADQIFELATTAKRERISHPLFMVLHWLESISPEMVDKVLKRVL